MKKNSFTDKETRRIAQRSQWKFTGARSAPKTPFCRPGESQDHALAARAVGPWIPAFAG